jgi:hypothetical protein
MARINTKKDEPQLREEHGLNTDGFTQILPPRHQGTKVHHALLLQPIKVQILAKITEIKETIFF